MTIWGGYDDVRVGHDDMGAGHDDLGAGPPGVDPGPDPAEPLETRLNPSHAPCPQILNRTAMDLFRPSISTTATVPNEMPGTSPAMTV